MIQVTRSVDQEAGVISYRFDDQGMDHEFQGRPCHAVAIEGAEGDFVKSHLRLMGYEHIGCGVKPAAQFGTDHIEYWAK